MSRFPFIVCRSLSLMLVLPSLTGCVTHNCAQHWLMHPEPAGIRNYVVGCDPAYEMRLASTAAPTDSSPISARHAVVAGNEEGGAVQPAVHRRLETVPSSRQ